MNHPVFSFVVTIEDDHLHFAIEADITNPQIHTAVIRALNKEIDVMIEHTHEQILR